jgi:hypothetical protein
MARASGKTMKVDVSLPLDVYETVVRLAEEADAPIHHRSNQRVLTPTVLQLIALGIQTLEENPELLTADISKRFTANDSRISALLNRVEKLESDRSGGGGLTVDRVTDIAKDEIGRALTPISEDLVNINDQLARLMALAQDDLDPYLARRSERMAAETAALKASTPSTSRSLLS